MIKEGDLVAFKRPFVRMHKSSSTANPEFKKALRKGVARVEKVLMETNEFRGGRAENNRLVQLDVPSFHKMMKNLVISTGWLKFVSRPKGKGHPEPKLGANP